MENALPTIEKQKAKIEKYIPQTYFSLLTKHSQDFLRSIALRFALTFQEFRQLTEFERDLEMWSEDSLSQWFVQFYNDAEPAKDKKQLLKDIEAYKINLKNNAKSYLKEGLERPKKREKGKIKIEQSSKNVFGRCPVESEKTVCCNLKTIDAVENCVFGCSYCTIQTFYRDETVFDDNLSAKLSAIELNPNKRYHIGTGQSSDSLAWGNKNNNLTDLCTFAENNPNIMLEFKTKSHNIRFFLEEDIPANIVCSWSLNPQIIIDNEEHFTASLEERIGAARKVADKGVKVAFHFHPIIYYENWRADYTAIATRLMETFSPEEVLFISFGSVTFIKPVLKKIRKRGLPTKITQMELVTDPHGKMTYPDNIKIDKFRTMYHAFKPWRERVFFYLCMEKASLWEESFGYVFKNNDQFEETMLQHCFSKIYGDKA